jgi:antirestriction protein
MISLYSRLLGIDPELVKRQPNGSRLKIITLGQLMLIPVLLWSISGFLMAYTLIGSEWYISILIGFLCGGMIYIIDRSFITAYGNEREKLMFWLRVAFAILSGVLGAIAIDTNIFAGDIAEFQKEKASDIMKAEKEGYIADNQYLINESVTEREQALADYQKLQTAFLSEMDGKGTGIVGFGNVAKQKKMEAEEARVRYKSKETELSLLKDKLDVEAIDHASKKAEIGEQTVMKKIHDFHEFVFSSGWNITFYGIFFFVILMAETMLILYKSGAAKTALDEAIETEEVAAKQRMHSLNRQREKYNDALAELGEPNVKSILQISSN